MQVDSFSRFSPIVTDSAQASTTKDFASDSDAAALIRRLDWSKTPIGAFENWPQRLREVVNLCLGSGFPIMVLWGPELVQIYNDAYRTILGQKHPQAMGQRTQDCWPELWQINAPIYQALFSGGKAINRQDQRFEINRSGYLEESYFTCSNSPIQAASGEVEGILVTVLETTQQVIDKRRLQTLRDLSNATANAQTVQDTYNAAIDILAQNQADIPFALLYLLQPEGHSAWLAATCGLQPNTPASPSQVDLMSNQPDIWSLGKTWNTRVEEINLEACGALAELPWIDPPASALVVSSNNCCLVAGINPRRALDHHYQDFLIQAAEQIGTAVAIAQRQEAECQHLFEQLEKSLSQLEAVIDSMGEGLIIADPEGKVLTMNPAALHLHGYKEIQEVHRPLEAFTDTFELSSLDGQILPVSAWPLARAMGGETFRDNQIQVRRLDTGKVWTASYSGTPVHNQQGQVMLTIVTVRDITAQKLSEAKIARSLEREQAARMEAEAANRIKDEFLAVLSHELRSPLNPILGWSKLLRSRSFDQKVAAHALETIERNAQLQSRLVEDLLDGSRILRGKLSLKTHPVDLSETVAASLKTMRLAAEAKSIQIQTLVEPGLGQVLGDANRLQQVVWNLLSNAIKFTPPEGQVQVRLEPQGNQAQLQVKDTGEGIHPGFLPHLFESFRQADSTTTRRFGGLGLGLAIARHLVELHGGTIQAESPGEEQGATFTIRLPLLKLHPSPAQDPEPLHPASALENLQILVVSREVDTRELITVILEQLGANITAATSTAAALSAVAQTKPDLLVIDVELPEDSSRLLQQLTTLAAKQGTQVPPAIALINLGDLEQQHRSAGQAWLAKPIDPEEFTALVVRLANQTGLQS